MQSQDLLLTLSNLLGEENVLTDPAECLAYGYDNSRRQGHPEGVVFATQTKQIQQIVELCNQYQICLTARGRGTGTPGGSVPIAGGIVLSLERMNKILKVDPDNRVMVVEPGVLNQTVQKQAEEVGFFWAPDPSSSPYCTVGGNLAYNSAGPRAVKYGATRENTLGLKAITGAGHLIQTGTYTTKGAVGYDLTRLLIGSEGTLAIMTEANLKLTPLPETKQTLQAIYTDISFAAIATARIMAQPVTPCALEFMDEEAIALVRATGFSLPLEAKSLLMIEVDGLVNAMSEATSKIAQAATNDGLINVQIANNSAEAELLWQARKALSPALRTIASGKINEDVVVPVTEIPVLLQQLTLLAKKYQIKIVNFGHAGNGNIHVNLLFDVNDGEQVTRARSCLDEVFSCVLKLGGTLSGEHGIGIEKRDFMSRALTQETLALMHGIKQVFDPNKILNPGKIFI